MRLVTLRTDAGTVAGRQDDDGSVREILDVPDVGALLNVPEWRERAEGADGPLHEAGSLDLAPVVTNPSKVLCVGLNYASHITEMGRDLPEHPTLFAKYADTLTGPYDDLPLPLAEEEALDWEAELVVVIGRTCRRVSEADAADVIAGYTVANDVSMRSWQFRTKEWLQGKMWDRSTPVGPALVTADEWSPGPEVSCAVDGETMQQHATSDLVFGPEALVAYASTIITLRPGDLILTGTPGGVGHARDPQRYLTPGNEVVTAIEGLGELRNRCVADPGSGGG
jgi:acylpyruvate hydrolase